MSTGSTEGYNAEVFIAQGSTRLENYGHSRFGTAHYFQHYASTVTHGATMSWAYRCVTNSSTNVTFTLPPPKLGAEMRIWVVGATSSGIHTFNANGSATIKGTPGTTEGNEANMQNSGFVDVYCPSTTVYIVAASGAGSSDFAVSS